MHLSLFLWANLAWAGDPVPAESPPPSAPLDAPPPDSPPPESPTFTPEELEALLRDAEAAVADTPPPPPQAPARASFNAFNPGLTAFGDIVGQLGASPDGVASGSTLYVRAVELELRADVDPFAKADAVISFEQEAPPIEGGAGEGFGAEPEEAYVDLVSMPAHLSLRIGKFRAPFGIVNRVHNHDLPWVDRPAAAAALGDEGIVDTGASLGWIIPMGPAALTLTAGAFSGDGFDETNERANLATLGRAELFAGFRTLDVALGASVVADAGEGGFTDPEADSAPTTGADLTIRWRPNPRRSVLLAAEGFRDPAGDLSGYASLQVQPGRNTYVGVREDILSTGLVHNLFATYYTSEFLRVRVGGGYAPTTQTGTALAQLTFVWGSHPVEPWWVNK